MRDKHHQRVIFCVVVGGLLVQTLLLALQIAWRLVMG